MPFDMSRRALWTFSTCCNSQVGHLQVCLLPEDRKPSNMLLVWQLHVCGPVS